ncbi:unnamed protein product, partial [Hydatigera taeniaeformis]|uniref:Ion_trans domain-containing protein n=1 Tax=Hydatigena taeniaeformis TaxID=6205 RepID=A0A0R3WUG4_HYDTA
VSNKPRPHEPEPLTSGESSISSRRGTTKRSSLSRLTGNGTMDLATQRLLFKEVDPKGRPPPADYEANAPADVYPSDNQVSYVNDDQEHERHSSIFIVISLFMHSNEFSDPFIDTVLDHFCSFDRVSIEFDRFVEFINVVICIAFEAVLAVTHVLARTIRRPSH